MMQGVRLKWQMPGNRRGDRKFSNVQMIKTAERQVISLQEKSFGHLVLPFGFAQGDECCDFTQAVSLSNILPNHFGFRILSLALNSHAALASEGEY